MILDYEDSIEKLNSNDRTIVALLILLVMSLWSFFHKKEIFEADNESI
jgi:hypothetical protein